MVMMMSMCRNRILNVGRASAYANNLSYEPFLMVSSVILKCKSPYKSNHCQFYHHNHNLRRPISGTRSQQGLRSIHTSKSTFIKVTKNLCFKSKKKNIKGRPLLFLTGF